MVFGPPREPSRRALTIGTELSQPGHPSQGGAGGFPFGEILNAIFEGNDHTLSFICSCGRAKVFFRLKDLSFVHTFLQKTIAPY